MRVIKVLLIVLLLVGCQSSKNYEVSDMVDDVLTQINESQLVTSNNYRKDLVSYYLPKDVGVFDSNKISSVIKVENYTVFMGLLVSEILSDTIVQSSITEEDIEYVAEVETLDSDNNPVLNTIYIEQLSNNQYLTYVKVNDNFFMSTTPKAAIPMVLRNMLLIGRTVEVNKNAVAQELSNKETIDFQKEVIELFSESIPEEGFIKDIFVTDEDGD